MADTDQKICEITEEKCEISRDDKTNMSRGLTTNDGKDTGNITKDSADVKSNDEDCNKAKSLFKMPTIVPRFTVNKTSSQEFMLAKKAAATPLPTPATEGQTIKTTNEQDEDKTKPKKILKKQTDKIKQIDGPIQYQEPKWGGIAEKSYTFEVLKNGTVIDNLELSSKSFHVFGRLPSCDFPMEHPSLSRHHAVVQYCSTKTDQYEVGWYLYDLDSTHGTWMNKLKIRPRVYLRLRVGFVIKLGGSSRLLVLQGPSDDVEEESALTITELKQQRAKQKREAELIKAADLADIEAKKEALEKAKGVAADGCSWGMDADDAVEVNQDNPFAITELQNEELYIDDPKKALKGFFEREGFDIPDYHVDDEGKGSFRCTVELPVDNPNGQPVIAEATVSGKKREAVVACALEGCRILDRLGELRKAHHESRKRKPKNWADDDFYDSDEDTFLDRTGDIEKKREKRMKKAKAKQDAALTYGELKKSLDEVTKEVDEIQRKLDEAKSKAASYEEADGIDALDAFMASIKSGGMDSKTKMALKKQIFSLRIEQQRLTKLANIAKPPDLPPLPSFTNLTTAKPALKTLPMIGKIRGPSMKPATDAPKFAVPAPVVPSLASSEEEVEEEEEDDKNNEAEEEKKNSIESHIAGGTETKKSDTIADVEKTVEKVGSKVDVKDSASSKKAAGSISQSSIQARIQRLLGPAKPPDVEETETETKDKEQKEGESEKMDTSEKEKTVADGEKVDEKQTQGGAEESFETKEEKVTKAKRKPRIRKPKTVSQEDISSSYDATDPKYAMWLPPEDQSGDGTTSLNAKFGY